MGPWEQRGRQQGGGMRQGGGVGGEERTWGQGKDVGTEKERGRGAKPWGRGQDVAIRQGHGVGTGQSQWMLTLVSPQEKKLGSIKAPKWGKLSLDGLHGVTPQAPTLCCQTSPPCSPPPWVLEGGPQHHITLTPRQPRWWSPPCPSCTPGLAPTAFFDDVEPSFFLRQTSCKFSCSLYMRFFLLKRKSYCIVLLGPRSSPRGATPGPLSLRPSRACTSVQPGGCAKRECTCTSVRRGGVQGVRASAVCLWNVPGKGVRDVHGSNMRAGSARSRATQGRARAQLRMHVQPGGGTRVHVQWGGGGAGCACATRGEDPGDGGTPHPTGRGKRPSYSCPSLPSFRCISAVFPTSLRPLPFQQPAWEFFPGNTGVAPSR